MFRITFTSLLILSSYQLHAANVVYNAGVLFGIYENVNLISNPTESEFSQGLNLGLNVLEDSSSLYVNLDANFRSFNYSNNIAADRNNGQLLADLVWRITPGHFEWVLNNNFTQTVVDPLQSNAPANRQNANVFSTGPNYIIRLTPSNNLQLEARVENYSYQQYADNNRAATAIRWLHDVNIGLVLSLNNESELARFKNESGNLDFQRNDIFFGVNYARAANALLLEYGVTSIKNEFLDDITSDRYLFSFTNSRTQTSTIQFIYENYLSNTGDQILRLNPTDSNNGLPLNGVANDVFVTENYRLQYNKTITNGDMNFNAYSGTRRYDRTTNLDFDGVGFGANFRWFLKRNSTVIFNYRQLQTDYIEPDPVAAITREDADKTYTIEYRYGIKRNVNVSFQAISLERISTIETRSFEDLRFFISINYFSI